MGEAPSHASDNDSLINDQKLLTAMVEHVPKWRALRNAVHDLTGTIDSGVHCEFLQHRHVKSFGVAERNSAPLTAVRAIRSTVVLQEIAQRQTPVCSQNSGDLCPKI